MGPELAAFADVGLEYSEIKAAAIASSITDDAKTDRFTEQPPSFEVLRAIIQPRTCGSLKSREAADPKDDTV